MGRVIRKTRESENVIGDFDSGVDQLVLDYQEQYPEADIEFAPDPFHPGQSALWVSTSEASGVTEIEDVPITRNLDRSEGDPGRGVDPAVGKNASSQRVPCPYCGEQILAVAKKCKHCGSDLTGGASRRDAAAKATAADYGLFLLAIPIVGTVLIWSWVGSMNLLQSPDSKLALIMAATVLGTAIVAAMEASKAGMVTDRDRGSYSPTAWFFLIVLLWFVTYPVYLYKRRHYGLPSRLAIGIVLVVVFLFSFGVMSAAIEERKAEVRSGLEDIQRDIESFSW